MEYHPHHRCAVCGQRYERHAAVALGDVPKGRCAGKDAKWPTSIRDEKRAGEVFDKRVRRMWTQLSTTFRPV